MLNLKGGKTIPVGNLAIDGKIITQACDNESWINVHKKTLSTMIVDNYGKINFMRTDRLDQFKGLKMAVSGIPIIKNAQRITLDEIKQEGYFGNELYDTWHGGILWCCIVRDMVWNLVALGYRAI